MNRSGIWRFFLILSGLFLMAGGPLHPAGTTGEMLGHQDWVLSHALLLAGFVALLIGLILFSRRRSLSDRTRQWLRLATIGTALQAIEMVFHTAASVDHAKLLATCRDAGDRRSRVSLRAARALCALVVTGRFWPLHGDTEDRITRVLGPA